LIKQQWFARQVNARFFGARVQKTEDVKLSGTFLEGKGDDLPTMIWLPELVEPAENFSKFFNNPKNKISTVRNVWLLNYRN